MNGFNLEERYGGPVNGQYAYVPHPESKPYWDMAHEWVLADNMFPRNSMRVSSRISTSSQHRPTRAWTCRSGFWGCGGPRSNKVEIIKTDRMYGGVQRPCFDYQTLGDELDNAGLPWTFYTNHLPASR